MIPDWREVPSRVDRLVLRVVRVSQRVLFWPALYAIAWAAAIWLLTHRDRLPVWTKNALTHAERLEQLYYLLGTAGAMAVLVVGFLVVSRVRVGHWRVEAWAQSFNRLFAFSLAAPFLVALSQPGVESSRPVHTLFFITCTTACLLPTVAFLWAGVHDRWGAPAPTWRVRLGAIAPWVIVGGLFVAYSFWFSRLSINNHHALQTRIFDLGIYDNIFFQSSHGNFLGCSFSPTGSHTEGHFDPILVLLSPLYLIYPRAELILVLQAIWCGAGVVPAYLLGRHHVGSAWAGVTLAAAWVLYPALHGANLYDFHSLTLLAMPMLWLLYLLTTGRVRAFFVLLPFVLLVREDASLLVCCVGFTAVLTRDPRIVRAGWITIGVAALYFVLVKTFVMGAGDIGTIDPLGGKYGFGWYYKDMSPEGKALGYILLSLLTNPTFAIDLALREAKVIFLLQLLLPLAFLPLFGKPWRFAAVFGLFYILLASRRPVFSIHFQYSVVLFPVLFALTPIAIQRLREGDLPERIGLDRAQLVTVLLVCILASSLLMSWKFGGAVPNSAFRGGWARIPHTLTSQQERRYEEVRKLVDQIPANASVTVTARLGPHLSNRADVWRYQHGKESEYLMLDTRDLRGRLRREHQARLDAGKLELLAKDRTVQLFRFVD